MSNRKIHLSKSILEMKFMKRTKEKVLKEEDTAEMNKMYSNEITEKMLHGTNFIIESSYVNCEDLIVGRLSYGGMNPELERLLAQEESKKNQEKEKLDNDVIKDVSDESMARHYGNLVQTIKRKFQNKSNNRHNEPNPKKRKFMKPNDL